MQAYLRLRYPCPAEKRGERNLGDTLAYHQTVPIRRDQDAARSSVPPGTDGGLILRAAARLGRA